MQAEKSSDNDGAGDEFSAPFYFPDFTIEKKFFLNGKTIIAGIDEAGRGALAGPLSVSMVIFSCEVFSSYRPEDFSEVNDSKKLSPAQRESAALFIRENSLYSATVQISHKIIDSINVNMATREAIIKLIAGAEVKPDVLLIDGNFKFGLPVESLSVKRGDSRSLSIAAASVLAKTTRDKIMKDLDKIYPEYGFKENKGYGTEKHLNAIRLYGGSKIHRYSYQPLKGILNPE